MDSDMFGLGETWLQQDQEVHFNGFRGYFANFGRGKGQAAFSKLVLSSEPEIVASNKFSSILLKTSHFNTIFLYLSQNYDKNSNKSVADRLLKFRNDIKDGPNYICNSCNRELFRNSVKILAMEPNSKLKENKLEKLLTNQHVSDEFLLVRYL